jgi:hypothetical protein
MWRRYTRHCACDERAEEGIPSIAALDSKGPALTQRDFEVLDILCSADKAGILQSFRF